MKLVSFLQTLFCNYIFNGANKAPFVFFFFFSTVMSRRSLTGLDVEASIRLQNTLSHIRFGTFLEAVTFYKSSSHAPVHLRIDCCQLCVHGLIDDCVSRHPQDAVGICLQRA